LYVNDAFGTAHRAHASTEGVTHFLPACAGFLLAKELAVLERLLAKPERPFVAIIGGAKVSTKLGVLNNLIGKVDVMVIGGAMAFTFIKARGHAVGRSLVEDNQLAAAGQILQESLDRGVKLILPCDVVLANDLAGAKAGLASSEMMPSELLGVDIGPGTLEEISAALQDARTIFWNGPMGVFENRAFAEGTLRVAQLLAARTRAGATTVVGGGDSVAALEQAGLTAAVTHVSTGGGASLEFLEGRTLPGVAALMAPAPARA
ncbi:MAG: phosphoglycerate kinase, partial [Cyanobacteria bacterium NC_groundwater_1444_Ag_S-0.65um_54_12]|nr:phosphoglycerate kinase [Cyanobacteria bacterium NC_groundwater_1444_Ag_S-0.65um_54_12]